jgi:hypothetical protein
MVFLNIVVELENINVDRYILKGPFTGVVAAL